MSSTHQIKTLQFVKLITCTENTNNDRKRTRPNHRNGLGGSYSLRSDSFPVWLTGKRGNQNNAI